MSQKVERFWGFCPFSRSIGGIVNLSISFFMIFFAYNTAQNYQTSLRGQTGYFSVGIIYVTFALSSLFSPSAVDSIGEKVSLMVGSFCYLPFVLSNAFPRPWLLLSTAAINGIGAGFLWAAQGVAVMRCAGDKSRYGFFSGIFFSVYQCNQLAGNLFAAISLGAIGEKWLFVALSAVLGLGVLSFAPLQLPSIPEPQSKEQASDSTPPPSLRQRLLSTLMLLREKRMLWLILPTVFNGTK